MEVDFTAERFRAWSQAGRGLQNGKSFDRWSMPVNRPDWAETFSEDASLSIVCSSWYLDSSPPLKLSAIVWKVVSFTPNIRTAAPVAPTATVYFLIEHITLGI